MKIRNYEKNTLIKTLIVILILIELITVLYLFKSKNYAYIKLTGIVEKDNLVTLIVDENEKK